MQPLVASLSNEFILIYNEVVSFDQKNSFSFYRFTSIFSECKFR